MSTDPSVSPCSTYSRPGSSLATAGGCSSPWNLSLVSLALPMSMPMYDPDSSVLSPDMPPAAMRGRTIQKRESLTSNGPLCLLSSACTRTPLWSGVSSIERTTPMSTLR